MGEGINRLFGIALALVNAKGGILLVDEIESGLHFSVQVDLWRLIFKVANRLNVQVFATTHSQDAVEAFQKASPEDQHEEAMLIRLENKKGEIVVTQFNERRLATATREDIEVR
jgi:AAA15 family ATPase/GTPase